MPPMNEAAAVAWKARRKALHQGYRCFSTGHLSGSHVHVRLHGLSNLIAASLSESCLCSPSKILTRHGAEAMVQVWRIVGGTDKGGIVVRDGEGLRSQQLRTRLVTGTLVEELETRGSRLHFRLLDGCGPPHGWISLQVGGKDLAVPAHCEGFEEYRHVVIHLRDCVQQVFVGKMPSIAELKALLLKHPTWTLGDRVDFKKAGSDASDRILLDSDSVEGELEVIRHASPSPAWYSALAALRAGATDAMANESLKTLRSLHPSSSIHLATGLVLWKWYKFEACLKELEAAQEMESAANVLLALQICLGRWPEAAALAEGFPEAAALIAGWSTGVAGHFAPSSADFVPETVELRPGLRQMDARIPTIDGVSLGVRLFLQMESGSPRVSGPLVLYFHGNAENVDTYKDPEVFAPLQAASASALIVDFRGYGFSTGGSGPSLSSMNMDAERVCDALPEFFKSRDLPWPWPGGLVLFGRSMGGICACHLSGLRGHLFDGVVLESTMCGSHAPGAAPPPEPPPDGSGMSGGSRFAPPELTAAASQTGELCKKLVHAALAGDLWNLAETDLGIFVHTMGSEDKLRGYTGRLLILHGELDTIVPVSHSRRLCDAAVSATRRLVTIAKGHNDISSSSKYTEMLKKFLSGS